MNFAVEPTLVQVKPGWSGVRPRTCGPVIVFSEGAGKSTRVLHFFPRPVGGAVLVAEMLFSWSPVTNHGDDFFQSIFSWNIKVLSIIGQINGCKENAVGR